MMSPQSPIVLSSRPNLVFSATAHLCFQDFFHVERGETNSAVLLEEYILVSDWVEFGSPSASY